MGDISIKGSSKILRTGRVEPFEITPLIGPKGGGGKIAGKQFKKFKKIIKKTPGKQINKSQKKKIIQQETSIKRKFEAKGEEWKSPIKLNKGGKV